MPVETITAPAASASVAGQDAAAESTLATTPTATEEPITGAPTGAEAAEPEAGHESAEAGTGSGGKDSADGAEDSRVLPKAIRALKATDPKAYVAEKTRFFEHRDYKATFPTVAEAKKARQSLELVGGEAGLTQLQTDISEFRNVAQQFMAADPKFSADLAEADPIAFGSHVPHIMAKFAEVDREGYNREIAKQFTSEFEAIGLRPALETAYQQIKAGKVDEGLAILNKLAKWHDDVRGVATKEDDPRYKKLQDQLRTERESKAKEGRESFRNQYITAATQQIDVAAGKLVDSYLKGKKLDADDRLRLLDNVRREADADVIKDSNYTQQRDLLIERGDVEASVRFAVSRYEQALSAATKKVMRTFGKLASPETAPRTTPPANGTVKPPADGWVRVSERPKAFEIDSKRTPGSMILNQQRAVLKDGRKVTWATVN